MSMEAESSAKSVTGVLEENTNSIANGSIETGVPTSEIPISPRVSTVDTDEASVTKKEQHNFQQEASQDYRDYSAPGLDSLHWAGVKKRGDFDQRSVASSMNAERDDQSIYEQPGVGAVEEAEEQLNESAADDGAYPTNLATPGHEEEQPHEDDHKDKEEQEEEGEGEDDDEVELKANEKMAPPPVQARAATASHKASSSLAPSITDADMSSVPPPSEENDLLEEMLTMENTEGRVEGRKQGYDGKHDSPDNPTDANDSDKLKSDGELVEVLAGEVAGMEVSTSPRTLGLPPSPVSRTSTDYEPLPESSSTARSTKVDPLQALQAQTAEENVEHRGSEVGGDDVAGTEALENHRGGVAPQGETTAAAATAAELNSQPSNVEEDVDLEETDIQSRTQPPAQDGPKPTAPMMVDLGPEWENAFRGLLYMDGMDALGRPVVVLNADAVPPRMKSSALVYVKAHLEPLVTSGEYVIVFTARKAKLPSFWIMGAYHSLPRPYRKNVQYVVLVRPTGFLKAILAFMRPFVSRKAGRKIKTVDRLEEIGEVTGGEVTMHHLGKRFLDDDAMAAATMASAN